MEGQMSTDVAVRENGALVTADQPSSGLALSFAEMTMRVRQLDQFYREVMQNDTDYGVIPGTQKPSLYQPGAQMLDQIFGLVPSFDVQPSSVIDWQRPIPFFHYIVRCRLMSRRSGELVAEAIGSCNTHEDRYRWRTAKRVCPDCKAETIIKGKQEYGGGWLCFKRNGGCGAKFRDGEAIIEDQRSGRVENEDTASLENTVLKMAQKRAHVAATLNATGASRIFTQDVEDLPQFQNAQVVESRSEPAPQSTPKTTNRANWPDGEPPVRPDDEGTGARLSPYPKGSRGEKLAETANARRVVKNGTVVKDNAPPKDVDNIDADLDAATRKNLGRAPMNESAAVEARAQQFEKSWARGVEQAQTFGADVPEMPDPRVKSKDELQTALKAFAAAVGERRVFLDGERLKMLTTEAQRLGIDVEVIDPATLAPEGLAETIDALQRMVDGATADQDAPADDDDGWTDA